MKKEIIFSLLMVLMVVGMLLFGIILLNLPIAMGGNAVGGSSAGSAGGSCGKANYVFCDDDSECCSNNCCNGICLSSEEECIVTGDDLKEAEKTIITKGQNTIFLEFTNNDGEEYYGRSKRILIFCYDVPTNKLGLCEDIYPEREYLSISELGEIENGKIILESEKGATIIIDSSEYKISFIEEDGDVIETEFIHDGERFKMSDVTGVSQGRTDYGSYVYQSSSSIIIYYLESIVIPEEEIEEEEENLEEERVEETQKEIIKLDEKKKENFIQRIISFFKKLFGFGNT